MKWGKRVPCKEGDVRDIKAFLWIPLNLRVGDTGKHEWRWLEKARIHQLCTMNFDGISAWLEWENQYFIE